MSTLNKFIILLAISVLFSCNDEDAFSIDPDAVNSASGGSGIAGAGVADDPGNISTAVANLSIFSDNVANIDGTSQPFTREVMMSGDGNVILVVTDEDIVANNADGLHQIYQYDEGTKLYTQLTNFSNANNTGLQEIAISLAVIPVDLVPVLSGDGSTIAFIHTYDPLGTNADGSPELFIIDVSSGVVSQPTSDLFTKIHVLKPSITNDGSTIAFVSRDDYTTDNPSALDQIFTITTDGSNTINQITDNQFVSGSSGGYFTASNAIDDYNYHLKNNAIVISGDGSRIVFKSNGDWLNDGSLPSNAIELFYINIDGSSLTKVSVADTNYITNPQISDDGNVIVFNLSDGGNSSLSPSNLFMYNVTTGITSNLTNSTDDIRFYAFALSGDGSQVIYRWQDNIQNTTVGSLDFLTVTTDGLNTIKTIFSIPSQPIEDVNGFSWAQTVIPDFIFFPKTTIDGSKAVFATNSYRLPPANKSTAESQLYMAITP